MSSKDPLPSQLREVSDLVNETLRFVDRVIEQAEKETLDLMCRCGRALTVEDINIRCCGECSTRITVIVGGNLYS